MRVALAKTPIAIERKKNWDELVSKCVYKLQAHLVLADTLYDGQEEQADRHANTSTDVWMGI